MQASKANEEITTGEWEDIFSKDLEQLTTVDSRWHQQHEDALMDLPFTQESQPAQTGLDEDEQRTIEGETPGCKSSVNTLIGFCTEQKEDYSDYDSDTSWEMSGAIDLTCDSDSATDKSPPTTIKMEDTCQFVGNYK